MTTATQALDYETIETFQNLHSIYNNRKSPGASGSGIEHHMERARATHIREIALAGRVHNNKMERTNGEIRDREKVMRGLKRMDTPILKGYKICHNYMRPHEGLQGDTPASRAGIKIEGENKWITLIQNASKVKT